MRLEILERGHRRHVKALLALIRLVSRQPVVDAVKLAFYRPGFYGGGRLTHEAMRGPSAWSVGDRELMAAVVAQANRSAFCITAHTTTSSLWYRDSAKVAATLANLDNAPVGEPLKATLKMLDKLSREHRIDADCIDAALDEGVSSHEIKDALAVGLVFDITARLANAFGFDIPSAAAMDAGARHLLKRGYK